MIYSIEAFDGLRFVEWNIFFGVILFLSGLQPQPLANSIGGLACLSGLGVVRPKIASDVALLLRAVAAVSKSLFSLLLRDI